jgi:hypothetical protein
MSTTKPVNCCHRCGATSYRRGVMRNAAGAMISSGAIHCSGCTSVFPDLNTWRNGEPGSAQPPFLPQAQPVQPWTTTLT